MEDPAARAAVVRPYRPDRVPAAFRGFLVERRPPEAVLREGLRVGRERSRLTQAEAAARLTLALPPADYILSSFSRCDIARMERGASEPAPGRLFPLEVIVALHVYGLDLAGAVRCWAGQEATV